MDLAQKLFEQGLITYHRTDSHEMSADFAYTAREFAQRNKLPLPAQPYQYKAGKNAQQGHECLRVTDINLINPRLVGIDDQFQILAYQLIWQYSLESQLDKGRNEIVRYEFLNTAKDLFVAQSTRVVCKGWRDVARKFIQDLPEEEKPKDQVELPELFKGDDIQVIQADVITKHTEKPDQFSESSLVDTLEKMGIGRPSTYAQIIETLVDRKYIDREKQLRLISTDIGKKVVDTLKTRFSFLEYNYTAKLESDIDKVASGQSDYLSIITAAYDALAAEINIFCESHTNTQVSTTQVHDGDTCPQCNKGKLAVMSFSNTSKKNSGKEFIGCSGFPTCKFFQWVH